MAIIGLCVLLFGAAGAPAASSWERELELDPRGTFVLDTSNGRVAVNGTRHSGVRISIDSPGADLESLYEVELHEQPGRLEIGVRRKGSGFSFWRNWFGHSGLRFQIDVPRECSVHIRTSGGGIALQSIRGEARLRTSGGSITARDVAGGLRAETSGGSIEAREVQGGLLAETSGGKIELFRIGGNLRAETSGGSIRIHDAEGDVAAETSGGSIRIEEVGGEARAETSGGSIAVRFAARNSHGGRLSTSGGSIEVWVDPTVDLEIDARSSGGGVSSELPLGPLERSSRSTMRGSLGSGGPPLHLRTSGGPIRLRSR